MIDWLHVVKPLHVALALASGAGFVLRGAWMLRGSPLLRARAVRIAPHLIDTALLASGAYLAVALAVSPAAQPWFATKLALIVAYIVAGALALRRGRTRAVRAGALVAALACYALILACALTRRPLGLP